MRRHKIGRRKSRRMFTKTAQRSPAINYRAAPMRGGIRL